MAFVLLGAAEFRRDWSLEVRIWEAQEARVSDARERARVVDTIKVVFSVLISFSPDRTGSESLAHVNGDFFWPGRKRKAMFTSGQGGLSVRQTKD